MKPKFNEEEIRKALKVKNALVTEFKGAIKPNEYGVVCVNFSINCIPEDIREFFKKRSELWREFNYCEKYNGVKQYCYCSNLKVFYDRVTAKLEKIE